MEQPARRLRVLQQHIQEEFDNTFREELLHISETSATASGMQQEEFAVALPEVLTPEGPWLVRRNVNSVRKLVTTFPPPDDHVRTLYDNWEASVKRYAEVPFLGMRELDPKGNRGAYKWLSYAAAGQLRTALGSGLLSFGIAPGSTIGLYSINCSEWCLIDAGCHAYSMVTVPLYDTLGADSVQYICNHAELSVVCCSLQCLPNMLKVLPECPTIKLVVVYGLQPGQWLPAELPRNLQARVITFDELRSAGDRQPRPHIPPPPDTLATICYTSGTTGVPKGAMLTHANLIANSAGYIGLLDLNPGDKHISYLPLAHIYERVNLVTAAHCGCSIGFYSGNVLELLDDIQVLKPTLFPSVPRLWNRIYDRVMGTIQSSNAISRGLFATAYAHKKAALQAGAISGGTMGAFWDKLVFAKIKARLGGEVRYLTTGASPIAPEVFDFLRICFGATVLEGYGMTETACTITLTQPSDPSSGHVGAPTMACEVKLEDIPEMNYLNSDKPYPRGEICVRGPIVFQGYFKAEDQTREVLDDAGWLHTGDVGLWLPGGRLKIFDRKKNIFKLSQGEYIAPEKIESVYAGSPFVMQSFVYGNSFKSKLVGVVVPDPETLIPWAEKNGLPKDMGMLCKEGRVVDMVWRSMLEEGKAKGLNGYEQVAAIILVPEPFSVENSLLTPTFKLKRPQAQAAFQTAIDAMYGKLNE